MYRALAVIGTAIAVFFAVRDALGLHDQFAVTALVPEFHDRAWGCIRILMLSVAAMVAWTGSARAPARFLAAGLIGLSLNNNWWFYASDDVLIWPSVALNYLGIGFGEFALMRFAASYGSGDWAHVRATVARLAPVIGALIALFGTLWWRSELVAQNPIIAYNVLFWIFWIAASLCVVASALVAFLRAPESERYWLGWVCASVSASAAGIAVHGIVRLTFGESVWVNNLDNLAQAALPIGLGYAILRGKVLEVDFAVSRVTLFGLLASISGVAFSTAEELSTKFADALHLTKGTSSSYAGAADFAISLAIVLSYRSLEQFTDSRIDSIRSKTERDPGATELLALAREIVSYRDSDSAILAVRRAAEAFGGCSSIALYWSDPGADLRLISSNFAKDGVPGVIARDDADLVRLTSSQKPAVLTGTGTLPPLLAFPIATRGALRGVALCATVKTPLPEAQRDALAAALQAAGTVLADSAPDRT